MQILQYQIYKNRAYLNHTLEGALSILNITGSGRTVYVPLRRQPC